MKSKAYVYPLLLLAAFLLSVVTGRIVLGQSSTTHGTAFAALELNHADTRSRDNREQLATNPDCTLIVPAHPLSAHELATPYRLVASDPQNGSCSESNKLQAAFVQGAIIDPATGTISLYNPLVTDQGAQPAIAPEPPFGGHIPPGDTVAL